MSGGQFAVYSYLCACVKPTLFALACYVLIWGNGVARCEPPEVKDNLGALDVIPQLTPEVMMEIDEVRFSPWRRMSY